MKVQNCYWGNPKKSDYDLILDYYSATKINSIQTSSVPLAQYWKNTDRALEKVAKALGLQVEVADVYFEYPTKSSKSNKASMSDVMIITENSKIAIEAKYTEYAKIKYETINDWLKKGNNKNKIDVLEHWKNIVSTFSNLDLNNLQNLPYQFLHRSASACFENPGTAFVMFQLFWDDKTSGNLKIFINDIKKYVDIINPMPKLNYYIHTIEITNCKIIDKNDVFQKIKDDDVYSFGKEEFIKILST